MKVLISAAETSSDQHGAQLLDALKRLCPPGQSVEAIGVGGPRLKEAGLRTIVDARELLAMGFFEVLTRLPRIFRALREIADVAAVEKPDLAIVIDYPDFHFRLAKRLRRLGVPVVYYIPPKVWVWRKGRIKTLRDRFVRVLSILPFEVDFYRRENVPVSYVGNPLVDELPWDLTREQARQKLGLTSDEKVLLLMPGSRPSELRYHLELMLDAALGAARSLKTKLTVLVPFPQTVDLAAMKTRISTWTVEQSGAREVLDIRPLVGRAPECQIAADVGLIKSGTSTLEAGSLGCVHSIVFRTNAFSHFVFNHLIRLQYKGPVGLVNLVHGWREGEPWMIREFTEVNVNSEELAAEVVSLFTDPARRRSIQAGLSQVRKSVLGEGPRVSPSEKAAREVWGLLQ